MESAPPRAGFDESALTLAALRGLLELSHLSLSQPPLPEVLSAVARVVAESLGFNTVVINAYRADEDSYEVTTVHGSERAREILLGNVSDADSWTPLLDPRFERHGVYFIPAGAVQYDASVAWYTPDLPDGPPAADDAWNVDDALFAPIEGVGGRRYGIISVDEPGSGRRPDDRGLEVLGVLAAHAAAAIESARQLRALEGALERHRAVLTSALDCVIATDRDGRVVEFNPAAERTFGYRAPDVVGRRLSELIIPAANREAHERAMARGLATGQWRLLGRRVEMLAMRSDGSEFPAEISLAMAETSDPGSPLFYGFVRDISERRRGEEELTYRAYHDPLTGLPNRILAEEQIELALARARRSNAAVAIMFIDLDGFKEVNDRLGHVAGDHLLSGVASRLRRVLRDSDMLARQGGDEFLVLLADLPAEAEAAVENVAGKLLDALREPFDIAGHKLRTGASIGVSLYPADADDTETLLRHADAAMYTAKGAGGSRLAFHERSDAILSRRASLSAQLRRAIAGNELELHYQPVWSLSGQRAIVGVEALLRWQHPEHGLLRPDAFINTAEQSLAGDELADWILREACRQTREWHDHGLDPLVGLNVPRQQLSHPSYAELLSSHLRGRGLNPRHFLLEITESAWAIDSAQTREAIGQLHELGAIVALDDFGAGYTSLTRLHGLPCDVIKVDRSLMVGVPSDDRSTRVARAALDLACACDVPVVAEGIETAEQVDFLLSLGIDHAQGFLFGHPLRGDRLTALLARHRPADGGATPADVLGVAAR